jgi:hypothetical protein
MSEQESAQDSGNVTKKVYQLATQPIFASDQGLATPDISWEVSDGISPELPFEENPQDSDREESLEETPLPEEENSQEQPSEAEKEEDPDEEKENLKKKNRVSEKKRIAELTRKLKQAQAVTHDVLSRNQYLETKLTEKQKEALESEGNFLASQKERVKQYLTDAIEEGDPKKIAEANDLLSQYNAQIQLKKTQTSTFESSPKNTYTPPSPAPDEADDVDNEEGHAWLENNNWANPNSEDFDQDLYNVADEYSIKLAKKYALQGKKAQIGSPKFWGEITNYMNKTFDISDDHNDDPEPSPIPKTQPKGRTPMKTTPSNTVAPVNRQSVPGEPPKKSNDIVLTAEQREAAHAMRGYVRDPKTGQKITDNKSLEEIYKRNMRI